MKIILKQIGGLARVALEKRRKARVLLLNKKRYEIREKHLKNKK